MIRQPGVYTITNTVNGRVYVGSAVNVRRRMHEHYRALHKGNHHSIVLQRGWNKYGEDAFEFKTILVCEPFEVLRYEQALIELLKPKYNICPTARTSLGRKCTEATKAKISSSNKGREQRPISDATREKHRMAMIGNSHRLGVTLSLETRTKMSAAQKERRARERGDWL